MELTDNEFIHRVELARGDAWEVTARHGSYKSSRVFIDRLFGGAEPALQAARAWRDEILEEMRSRAAKPSKPVLRGRPHPRSRVQGTSAPCHPDRSLKTPNRRSRKGQPQPSPGEGQAPRTPDALGRWWAAIGQRLLDRQLD